ncbi:MAG: hypothetical protein ACLGGV_08810 [Bacteroidia bacterium]
MKKFIVIAFVLVVGVMLLPIDVEAQCAMCKASTESAQKNASNIANGLNKGILFLMAIPYILLILFFRTRIIGLFKSIIALYKNPQKI